MITFDEIEPADLDQDEVYIIRPTGPGPYLVADYMPAFFVDSTEDGRFIFRDDTGTVHLITEPEVKTRILQIVI